VTWLARLPSGLTLLLLAIVAAGCGDGGGGLPGY
jgi:hypothetical protein